MTESICYHTFHLPSKIILEDNILIIPDLSEKNLESLKETKFDEWLLEKILKYNFDEISIVCPNFSQTNLDFASYLTKNLILESTKIDVKINFSLISTNEDSEVNLRFF